MNINLLRMEKVIKLAILFDQKIDEQIIAHHPQLTISF